MEDTYQNADAIIILTEWNDYENINWLKISKEMRSPAWVFDTRGLVDPEDLRKVDINFWQIGNGLNS